jgi:hypothetical protein
VAQNHFQNRGQWWTTGKKRALKRWVDLCDWCVTGVRGLELQSLFKYLSKMKFGDHVYSLLNPRITGAQD